MSSDKERLVWSDLVHWIVTGVAALAACFLIWAMLFGTKPLNDYVEGMGVERTLRDTAIALWAFLLPAWFIIEEAWFAPTDPTKQERFRRRQRNARMTWVAVAGAVSILIGASAPKTNPTTPPSVQTR